MTNDERCNLLELKEFLMKAIARVDDQLVFTDPDMAKEDYDFLIDRVSGYQRNLE